MKKVYKNKIPKLSKWKLNLIIFHFCSLWKVFNKFLPETSANRKSSALYNLVFRVVHLLIRVLASWTFSHRGTWTCWRGQCRADVWLWLRSGVRQTYSDDDDDDGVVCWSYLYVNKLRSTPLSFWTLLTLKALITQIYHRERRFQLFSVPLQSTAAQVSLCSRLTQALNKYVTLQRSTAEGELKLNKNTKNKTEEGFWTKGDLHY